MLLTKCIKNVDNLNRTNKSSTHHNFHFYNFDESMLQKLRNYSKHEPVHTIFAGKAGSGKTIMAYYYLSEYFQVSMQHIMKLNCVSFENNNKNPSVSSLEPKADFEKTPNKTSSTSSSSTTKKNGTTIHNKKVQLVYMHGHYHFEIDVTFFSEKQKYCIIDILKDIELDRRKRVAYDKINIIFIKNADHLDLSVQHQLRRLSEQLYGKCVLFFFTKNIDHINDIIRSRCIELRFCSPNDDHLKTFSNTFLQKCTHSKDENQNSNDDVNNDITINTVNNFNCNRNNVISIEKSHEVNTEKNCDNKVKRGRKKKTIEGQQKQIKEIKENLFSEENVLTIIRNSNGNLNKLLLYLQYTMCDLEFVNPLNIYFDFLCKNTANVCNLLKLRNYMRTLIVSKLPLEEILASVKTLFINKLSQLIPEQKQFSHLLFLLFIKFVNLILEVKEMSFSKQYQIELMFLFIPKFFECCNDKLDVFNELQDYYNNFVKKYCLLL